MPPRCYLLRSNFYSNSQPSTTSEPRALVAPGKHATYRSILPCVYQILRSTIYFTSFDIIDKQTVSNRSSVIYACGEQSVSIFVSGCISYYRASPAISSVFSFTRGVYLEACTRVNFSPRIINYLFISQPKERTTHVDCCSIQSVCDG